MNSGKTEHDNSNIQTKNSKAINYQLAALKLLLKWYKLHTWISSISNQKHPQRCKTDIFVIFLRQESPVHITGLHNCNSCCRSHKQQMCQSHQTYRKTHDSTISQQLTVSDYHE